MSSQSARTLVHISTGLSTGLSGYVIGRKQTKKETTKYKLNEPYKNTDEEEQEPDNYTDISKVLMWRAID